MAAKKSIINKTLLKLFHNHLQISRSNIWLFYQKFNDYNFLIFPPNS